MATTAACVVSMAPSAGADTEVCYPGFNGGRSSTLCVAAGEDGVRAWGTAEAVLCVPGTSVVDGCPWYYCGDEPPSYWLEDIVTGATPPAPDATPQERKEWLYSLPGVAERGVKTALTFQHTCAYASPGPADDCATARLASALCVAPAPTEGGASECASGPGVVAAQCATWDVRAGTSVPRASAEAATAGTAGRAHALVVAAARGLPCAGEAAAGASADAGAAPPTRVGESAPVCAPPMGDAPALVAPAPAGAEGQAVPGAPSASPAPPASPSPAAPAASSASAVPASDLAPPTPPGAEAATSGASEAVLATSLETTAILVSSSTSASVDGEPLLTLDFATGRAPAAAGATEVAPAVGVTDALPGPGTARAFPPAPAADARVGEPARGTVGTAPPATRERVVAAFEAARAPAAPAASAVGLAVGLAAVALLVALAPLYHRLTAASVHANANRGRVLEAVRASPGATVATVARTTGLRWQQAEYHLRVLARHGSVRASTVCGRRVFWETSVFPASPGDADGAPTSARVLAHVRERPGATASDIRAATGLARTHVWYYLNRFETEGIVRLERGGPRVRVFPALR